MKENKPLVKIGVLLTALAALSLWAGCSNSGDPEGGSDQGHFHPAPHGGSLVMLGNHAAQLELVSGEQDGEWILYVLDGGAERFVRIEQSIIRVKMDGREVVFNAAANEATGETVGDTAQFIAKVDGLTSGSRFTVVIDEIVVYRQPFSKIEFNYPEGKH